MASTVELFRSAVQQAAAGEKVDSATLDAENPSSVSEGALTDVDDGRSVRVEESVDTDILPTDEDTPPDSSQSKEAEAKPASKAASDDKKIPADKEVITVTDDKGRRRVEVDLNDREKVKKFVQMAYGARKWQAERDQAIQSKKQLETETKELKENWKLMNQVFAEQGEEGLIDLLRGRKGAYQERLKQEVERAKFLEKASPEEVEALQARETQARQARELDKIRKENEEFKKQVQEEREAAELRSLESKVHPAFDKYRFADKLGDADDEHMFDEMLWNSALKRLEPYEEQGLDVTPELIEREFRTVASALRRRIGIQAEKKASKAIEQKKQEATENVQAKVMSGYKTGGIAKEARDLIQSNNLTGLLKNWNKYGNLFRK